MLKKFKSYLFLLLTVLSVKADYYVLVVQTGFAGDTVSTEISEREAQIMGEGASLREYLYTQSVGRLSIKVDVFNVNLPQSREFYGQGVNGKGPSFPNNLEGLGVDVLVALNEIDSDIDLSDYDNNEDGLCDGFIVITAGISAEDGGDGNHFLTELSRFSWGTMGIVSEKIPSGEISGIGPMLHVFLQQLGAPDLEDLSGETPGFGPWDPTSGGWRLNEGKSPPNLRNYTRVQLGWTEPVLTLYPPYFTEDITISPGQIVKIVPNPGDMDKFYLLESVMGTSAQDSFLCSHHGFGLMITFVDSQYVREHPVAVNDNPEHFGVELKRADGEIFGPSNFDLFPGEGRVTEFSDSSASFFVRNIVQTRWLNRCAIYLGISNVKEVPSYHPPEEMSGEIFNINGKYIANSRENLESGMYFIKNLTPGGERKIKKIIVVK